MKWQSIVSISSLTYVFKGSLLSFASALQSFYRLYAVEWLIHDVLETQNATYLLDDKTCKTYFNCHGTNLKRNYKIYRKLCYYFRSKFAL